MRVLIVDDETLARERMHALLQELDTEYDVVGEAADGQQAVKDVQRLKPDIVLLDIKMPVMGGIEAARHMAALDDAPAIIFSTAYDEHALAAFEINAIGYLLKPVQAEKLEHALQTASKLKQGQLAELETNRVGKQRSHIGVRNRGDLYLVPVAEIIYFRAEQKYIELRHIGGMALLEESIISLEQEFGQRFVRIHRNALVAFDAIIGLEKDSLGRSRVQLRNCDELLDVSRRHIAALRKLIKSRG